MKVNLLIRGGRKTVMTLQVVTQGQIQQPAHVEVLDRAAAALGWNQLFSILVAQARHDGLTGDVAIAWAKRTMSALGQISGVHPDAITLDDLKYLLSTATPEMVVLADNLMIEPKMSELQARGQELGDPYTPVDDPDPSFVEAFFTAATRSRREDIYRGWWSPIQREALPVGMSGGAGHVEALDLSRQVAMEDEELQNWSDLAIGADHRLIYIGQNRILDWVPAAALSNYRVWRFVRPTRRGDPVLDQLAEQQTWSTINTGHELIWLGRDLQVGAVSNEDLVLDWVPATGNYRLYRVDLDGTKSDGETPDILPEPPRARGNWTSIRASKKLIYLGGNRVLDWEPATGDFRIWTLERTASGATDPTNDPLPSQEVQGNWETIREGHRIINLGGDRVLTWLPETGWFRVWQYDRSVSGTGDPLVSPPLVEGIWWDIDESHELVWLGGSHVLEWQPSSGAYRIRSFDRTETLGDPLT